MSKRLLAPFWLLVNFGCTPAQDLVISQDLCALSTVVPRTSKYRLTFCSYFPDKACCLPAHDQWATEQWAELMGASSTCMNSLNYRTAAYAIQYIWCFGCSPDQPSFTYSSSTNATNDSAAADKVELRVCKSLADQIDLTVLGACGMIVPNSRYQLACGGDGVVVPSRYWSNVTDFLNDDSAGKPVFFENTDNVTYTVVLVDDASGDATPCLGGANGSALAEARRFFVSQVHVWAVSALAALLLARR